MTSYAHVAVAVEDSPGSHKALQEASRMAALTGARLSVLHVTSLPMPPPYMGEGGVFLPDPETMQAAALTDRKSTRLNSSHSQQSRMPSSA